MSSTSKQKTNNVMRVVGVDLPPRKHVVIALTSIHGIGKTRSQKICAIAGIEPSMKVCDLPPDSDRKIIQAINSEGILVEGDLKRKVAENIRDLVTKKCYRGMRHRQKLPVNGQRTSTNARTRKGQKKGQKKGK